MPLVASGTKAGVRIVAVVRMDEARAGAPVAGLDGEGVAWPARRRPTVRGPTARCSCPRSPRRRCRCRSRRRRRAADLDAARLALLGLRDRHLEHAAVEVRADRVGVDALGQRQRAAEAAERALDAVPAALALLVLGLALAADRQRVVADLDRDVALGQARQVGLEDEVVVGLDQVHRRNPALAGGRLFEEGVDEPVQVAGERLRLHEKCHVVAHLPGWESIASARIKPESDVVNFRWRER